MDFKLGTHCVHTGTAPDPEWYGVNSPIHMSTVTEYPNPKGGIFYLRNFTSPNADAVARKVCALEGAEAGVVFGSGMAAISTVLYAFLQGGDHVVFSRDIYGGTYHIAATDLGRFGIETTFVRSSDPDDFRKAIKKNTRLVYVESPSNPLLKVLDLRAVAAVAKERNVLTAIDNTVATPINQNPTAMGYDLVIHSATKYLNGHSDYMGGVVVGSAARIDELRKVALLRGGISAPLDCYLLERGLKTLALRVRQHNENALALATFLEKHPKVKRVHYHGLPSSPYHKLAREQMRGFGGLLSFEPRCSVDDFKRVAEKFQVATLALSLGGVETLCGFPAETSHAALSSEERHSIGIVDNLVRVSVGVEDIEDIKEDFECVLKFIGS